MTRRKTVILAIALAAVILAAGLTAGLVYLARINRYKRQVAAITIETIDLTTVRDGTYTGACDVGVLMAEVSVTVRGGVVTDITLIRHRNERGTSAERIPLDIVADQRFPAAVVSGATNSSKVILKAIESALTQGLPQ